MRAPHASMLHRKGEGGVRKGLKVIGGPRPRGLLYCAPSLPLAMRNSFMAVRPHHHRDPAMEALPSEHWASAGAVGPLTARELARRAEGALFDGAWAVASHGCLTTDAVSLAVAWAAGRSAIRLVGETVETSHAMRKRVCAAVRHGAKHWPLLPASSPPLSGTWRVVDGDVWGAGGDCAALAPVTPHLICPRIRIAHFKLEFWGSRHPELGELNVLSCNRLGSHSNTAMPTLLTY